MNTGINHPDFKHYKLAPTKRKNFFKVLEDMYVFKKTRHTTDAWWFSYNQETCESGIHFFLRLKDAKDY